MSPLQKNALRVALILKTYILFFFTNITMIIILLIIQSEFALCMHIFLHLDSHEFRSIIV
jgi:hypothetical protein